MNAIANVATNTERAFCFAGSNHHNQGGQHPAHIRSPLNSFAFGTPAPKINRQSVYAVREVTVIRHSMHHRDVRYVIFA